jgi:enoyl-CoA hydratase/carnithine racemase
MSNESWAPEKNGVFGSIKDLAELWMMLSKLMSLGMASLAIINGHCLAAGLFLALCHDFRIMIYTKANPKSKVCLNEVANAFPMPIPVSRLMECTVSP